MPERPCLAAKLQNVGYAETIGEIVPPEGRPSSVCEIPNDDPWHEENSSACSCETTVQIEIGTAQKSLIEHSDFVEKLSPIATECSSVSPNWLLHTRLDVGITGTEPACKSCCNRMCERTVRSRFNVYNTSDILSAAFLVIANAARNVIGLVHRMRTSYNNQTGARISYTDVHGRRKRADGIVQES